ncbi:hypothetical protein VV869_13515 [Photobacterium sp. MCCC 1A19761]|uniref:hypothetical protein n=1 Tax=Photobacterium sp. MCCC 1A19761 TaxID=3115000 RepID=UPI00307F441F
MPKVVNSGNYFLYQRFVTMSQFKKWTPGVTVTLAAVIGWGAFQFSGSGQSLYTQSDLHDFCPLSTQVCQQQTASVLLATDVIRPMQETEIRVNWPTLPADTETLVLSLKGHEMMMGIYQLHLSRNAAGEYSGQLMLPFCTEDEMTWRGEITPQSASAQMTPLHVSLRMIK